MNRNNRRLWFLVSIIFAASISLAETRVGIILPLTGPMAEWGNSIRTGIEFGANKLNSTTRYIFEDEAACNSEKALSAARKLLDIDKVSVLMTGCLNGTRAILPVSKKLNVLLVSLGLVDEATAQQERNFMVTPSASITAEADGISKLLVHDGKKKLAVIRVEDNFTEELMRGLLKDAASDGWKVLDDEKLSFTTTDFRPSLIKLSRHGIDSILIYAGTEQVVNAVRQFKELKINNIALYGGYVIEASPPPAESMQSLNGVRYVAAVTPTDDELASYLKSKGFKETFQTRVAADAVADVERGFSACDGTANSLPCLIQTIKTRNVNMPAYSGGFSYDENGIASRTVRPKTVSDGKYRWLEY